MRLLRLDTFTFEDELALAFMGISEDYSRFRDAVTFQNPQVKALGYNPSAWSLKHIPAFLPDKIIPVLLQFMKALLAGAPSQDAVISLEMILEEDNPFTADRVREVYSRLSSILARTAAYCTELYPSQAKRWEKARAELGIIIRKGANTINA